MTTGIYVNPNRKETALQAEELVATLVSRGFGCRKIFRLSEKETEGLDMLLVLGGDGTILRCAEICARVPVHCPRPFWPCHRCFPPYACSL